MGLPQSTKACSATSYDNIATGQYDSYRTGAYLNESTLTPQNVASSQFGYLFSIGVNANPIYAQPLIIHNVVIGSTAYCTIIIVASMDNYIYAFDGDNPPTVKRPYLFRSQQFDGPPAPFCVAVAGFQRAGVLGTPVFDAVHQLLYFVTLTNKTSPAQCGDQIPAQDWVYTLHTISFQENSGFGKDYFAPVIIAGTVPGKGDNATSKGCAVGVISCVPFVGSEELQRPALLDDQGTIYVAFGFGTTSTLPLETPDYHGWVFGYKSCPTGAACSSPGTLPCFTSTGCGLQQVSIFNSSPNAHGGGVWMSARGPVSDSNGGVFVSAGNACGAGQDPVGCSAEYGGNGYGESVVNLSTLDYFLPSAMLSGFTLAQLMNYNDLDLGSGGVLAIPSGVPGAAAQYLIAGSKVGLAFLLPTAALGGATKSPLQSFLATTTTAECPGALPIYPTTPKEDGCSEYRSPAFWSRGTTGFLYIWGSNDVLRGYPFNTAVPDQFDLNGALTPKTNRLAGNGGILAVSAESTTDAVNSILWAVTGNGNRNHGTLQAYQLWSGAAPVLRRIWSSDESGTNYFTVQRFIEPLVSLGKVYLTTGNVDASGHYSLWVYGLCSQGPGGVCGTQPGGPNN